MIDSARRKSPTVAVSKQLICFFICGCGYSPQTPVVKVTKSILICGCGDSTQITGCGRNYSPQTQQITGGGGQLNLTPPHKPYFSSVHLQYSSVADAVNHRKRLKLPAAASAVINRKRRKLPAVAAVIHRLTDDTVPMLFHITGGGGRGGPLIF